MGWALMQSRSHDCVHHDACLLQIEIRARHLLKSLSTSVDKGTVGEQHAALAVQSDFAPLPVLVDNRKLCCCVCRRWMTSTSAH